MRGAANIPAEGAYRLALKVLEIAYVQFLAYFKTILVHFFQRAIDVALYLSILNIVCATTTLTINIYLMRIDKNPVYLAKYKTPMASFRRVLFDAVDHWAEGQIGKFFESIPFFRNSDADRIEDRYRYFL